jgi:hypothetical protein
LPHDHGDLRDPAADADAIRYWRYHNDVIADTISWFALKVKEMSRAHAWSVFYGYMMVLNSAAWFRTATTPTARS